MADQGKEKHRSFRKILLKILRILLHLAVAIFIAHIYSYILAALRTPDARIGVGGAILLYLFIFFGLHKYDRWFLQAAKVAVFFLCLALLAWLLSFQSADYFSFAYKDEAYDGQIPANLDPRRVDVPVNINHDVRTTIVVDLNSRVSRAFEVSAPAYFYMALGVPRDTARLGPLEFKVLVNEKGSRPVEIHFQTITLDQSRWYDVFADMSEWAGKTVEVIIDCRGPSKTASGSEGPPPIYLVANPRLVPKADRERLPNVILIVVDTLRYDAANPSTMPHLAELAQKGVWFERAYSTSSWTGPSTASILTGLMPCQHGVYSDYRLRLSSEQELISELLKQHGYITAAASHNSIASSLTNFNQGFDVFMEDHGWVSRCLDSGQRLNQNLFAWLDKLPLEVPVFLYLHYNDPHYPYAALPPHSWERSSSLFALPKHLIAWASPDPSVKGLKDEYINCYRGECIYTDVLIGQMMDRLSEKGILNNSLVFITSDHGEGFLEHDMFAHGSDLHAEQVRVPLMFIDSRKTFVARTYQELVSNIDIFPTILEATGIPAPPGPTGRSLLDLVNNPDPDRAVFCELMHWHEINLRVMTMTKKEYRIFLRENLLNNAREAFAYNLATDPFEQNALPANRKMISGYLDELENFFQDLPPMEASIKKPKVDEDIKEALRALGYVK